MAADTRPYKSKEQDGQGNEVIIRDQQLVEQSTVTTMPSGACFETLDIDGRPVKIPRDNMMSIVLECIGIVLNDSSKNLGTNVNKALGLQGNTIGNVTVNDFASVLGVDWKSVQTIANTPVAFDLNGKLYRMVEMVYGGCNYCLASFNNTEVSQVVKSQFFDAYMTLSVNNGVLYITTNGPEYPVYYRYFGQ